MWIGSLYKNGPIQHICMSGVHSSIYSRPNYSEGYLDATLLELTNILQSFWHVRLLLPVRDFWEPLPSEFLFFLLTSTHYINHCTSLLCSVDLFLKISSFAFWKNLEKKPQKRIEYFRLLFNHLAWIKHQFLSGIRDSWKAGDLWGMMKVWEE